jgi:hypothetical protein
MKNQLLNIALEGTCSGDAAGGLLLWAVESLQALLFLKGGNLLVGKRTGCPKGASPKRTALNTTFT